MFSTLQQKLLLGVYIFILLSIPVGAYLASQFQTLKSSAQEAPKSVVKVTPKPTISPTKELLSNSLLQLNSTPSATPSATPDTTSPTIATSFGPTLSLKISIEARPQTDQSTKLFVGIIEGDLTSSPKFLLSFTVDLPKNGQYSNLSLAGLTSGAKYTAILKGSSTIASSSSFNMSPTVTTLNNAEAINLTSGDLNEDNVINSQDYSIGLKAMNSTSTSPNWNPTADLNKDGVVNVFDLGIISRNMGKIGAAGAWTSPIPKVATHSASISAPAQGNPESGSSTTSGGYWIWVPQ